MAGRITYLHPEAHNDCGYVRPVVLSQEVIIQIENIIGRGLSTEEIASMAKSLARIRIIKTGFKEATHQDTKRTLASFTKLSASDAIAAYKESDPTTQALIYEALVCDMKLSGDDSLYSAGENIKKAVSIAHENFASSLGGRPVKGYRKILAAYALSLWDKLGMGDCKPWHNSENAAPNVRLLVVLGKVIDGKAMDFKDAVVLLKEAE